VSVTSAVTHTAAAASISAVAAASECHSVAVVVQGSVSGYCVQTCCCWPSLHGRSSGVRLATACAQQWPLNVFYLECGFGEEPRSAQEVLLMHLRVSAYTVHRALSQCSLSYDAIHCCVLLMMIGISRY
jgi:hypothetical protein